MTIDRSGHAFSAITQLLTDTDRPIGERIHTADAIFDHALKVGRQLRMQATADYARVLHSTPGAVEKHNEIRERIGD